MTLKWGPKKCFTSGQSGSLDETLKGITVWGQSGPIHETLKGITVWGQSGPIHETLKGITVWGQSGSGSTKLEYHHRMQLSVVHKTPF